MNPGTVQRGLKLVGKQTTVLFLVVALMMGACGTRRPVAYESPSCEALMSATRATNSCLEPECDWVWVSEHATLNAILNPRDVRLNGVSGVSVSIHDEHWRVFDEFALRVDAVSHSKLTGVSLDCTQALPAPRSFVARPLAPRLPDNSGFELLAHASGERFGLASANRGSDLTSLDSTTLVLALGGGGLSVVDTHAVTEGELHEVTHIPALLGEDFNDVVAVKQRYVFAASKSRGFVVWDLLDPKAPTLVVDGFPQRAPKDGHNLLLQGDTLYLAQAPAVGTGALTAFDVSNPTRPTELWRFVPDAGHDVHDVNVQGDTVYVSSLRGGLYVLRSRSDEQDARRIEVVARSSVVSAHSVALLPRMGTVDRFAVSTERLGGNILLGSFDPHQNPITLAFESTTGALARVGTGHRTTQFVASPHNIECAHGICYVAHYQLGLRVFDWRRPEVTITMPVATFSTWQATSDGELDWLRGASGVLLTSSVVYVLDTQTGLFALRPTYRD